MQDRLSELRDGASPDLLEQPAVVELQSPNEDRQLKKKKSGLRLRKKKKPKKVVVEEEEDDDEAFMCEFFEFVKSLKEDFIKIQDGICAMETLYSKSLIASKSNKNQQQEDLQHVIDETNCSISRVRNGLIEIAQGNQQLKDGNPEIVHNAEFQIRENAYVTMRQKFLDLSKEYQDLQIKYKNKQEEKLERQIKIVDPSATEEEIQGIVRTGSVTLLMQQTVLEKGKAKETLLIVEQQRNELISLEQSILELHQLFADMALLIENQGELINTIESRVNRTVGYTRAGANELKLAQKHSKSARKKMILLLTGFLAGIGGIFGGLFAAFR